MKYCGKCGAGNADGNTFCSNCGAPLNAPAPNPAYPPPVYPQQAVQPPQPPYGQPSYPSMYAQQPVYPQAKPQTIRSSNPAVNLLKNGSCSPLFLVAVIGLSVALLFQFLSLIMGGLTDQSYFTNNSLAAFYTQSMTPVILVSSILALAPTALFVAGMWIHFVSARDLSSGNMSSTGLTLCRAGAIANMVLYGLALVFIIVALFISIAASGGASHFAKSYGSYGSGLALAGVAMGIVIFILIVLAGVGVLFGFYYVHMLKTIRSVKNTMQTGFPDNRISSFLAIMNFILAFFALFGSFSSGLVFLQGVGSSTCLVCMGILLLQYKKQMSALMAPQGAAASPQPVYLHPQGAAAQQQVYGNPQGVGMPIPPQPPYVQQQDCSMPVQHYEPQPPTITEEAFGPAPDTSAVMQEPVPLEDEFRH